MINSPQKIVIIDYGMGNIGSIINMFKYIGAEAIVSSNSQEISKANKLILPGIGHFDRAMENIEKLKLSECIKEMAIHKQVPFLGICLGMQIMCISSEEGCSPGLGLVDANVKKFNFSDSDNLKVPHMGWNSIDISKKTKILNNVNVDPRFYFVHSYYVKCNKEDDVLAKSTYGIQFDAAFEHGNLIGVQFHPEKSHKFGIALFRNYLNSY
ncbi:MAG: imidazole glycerol phosphate synthase, glutamine amidotransferase subunit [Bacteroidetes bacterium GWE2_39_28]|nr:MAG: imidazole glycerol phosphate synthase, glutamine amidotransferase subunit [Bacteroidetes bacterium GWE2_39_28]OFY13072.1 MAG: imidazole glycerol phosphate synthase, glutamine amidotransferase subunit [Bacteroidetes bacterium GWF2_39_10]OFZ09138.1 MAG: imidazole glycerol phosphate synthase, glutamine amidotransferase subunit [Bacteroidetes bacterium RIFOXYB2_FULL_39_7]OFZ12132.1 MAG: imidazole glycerol phosphate synthase, glutamine amidotransferase subunit [Bacteroidetes bacterium RIFOXYC